MNLRATNWKEIYSLSSVGRYLFIWFKTNGGQYRLLRATGTPESLAREFDERSDAYSATCMLHDAAIGSNGSIRRGYLGYANDIDRSRSTFILENLYRGQMVYPEDIEKHELQEALK